MLLSVDAYSAGAGGEGYSTAGEGGRGNGQSGGGGYYLAFDTRADGVAGAGAAGGAGYVAAGGAGSNVARSLTVSGQVIGSVTGQSGGTGADTSGAAGAGGGGGGAAALYMLGNSLATEFGAASQAIGGNGGNGGQGLLAGGGGGGGGAGLQAVVGSTNIQVGSTVRITGGNGGNGGADVYAGDYAGGGGGGGGASGIDVQGNANVVTVNGQVQGGNGGRGGTAANSAFNGTEGFGGVGVRITGNANWLVLGGAVSGGLSGASATRADAIQLIGNDNRLELQAGYSAQGNIVASGSRAVLALGGSANASLDTSKIGTQLQGFASFQKTGTSTWTLTGTTAASRTWTVLGGTLIGSTASLGNGAVSNSATLAFDQATNGTYSAIVSGAGNVNKLGAGTLILSSNQTYTGGTTVSAGTLQIGNGGTTGSVLGNIVDNAALSFNRADSLLYSGVISGTGSVTQQGAGTLILSNNQTYTGGTTVSSGTLQIGDGGTTGSVQGNIVDNAALRFNRADNLVYGGVISGTGSVTQQGAGTLTLSNNQTYTGGTTVSSGTLQIGNGGTTGSVQGNIVDNGALRFNRADNLVYGGVISGTGGVTQQGAGTLTLSNNHTYTGGTTVASGTLQVGNGGTTGSVQGNIVDNGALRFNRADNLFYGGVISGTGSVTQQGAGTLTLSNNQTYTGGTTVSSGTLQIGNGGTTGSVQGNIVDNGILRFNRADTLLYNGVISGTGSLTQQGAGTLTLSNNQTYTGGTTVSAGTLQIGNGGTTGSVAGAIVNNASLRFNRADDVVFEGVISGTGSVTKDGSNVLRLSGDNTYSGATVINGGTLVADTEGLGSGAITNNAELVVEQDQDGVLTNALNGSGRLIKRGAAKLVVNTNAISAGGVAVDAGSLIVGGAAGSTASLTGDVRVADAALLGGHGSITGDVFLLAGSTLAPGNSIGTLNVNGDVSFAPLSVFEVEVAPTGASDRLTSTGTVDLGSAALRVLASAGTWAPSTAYTIVSANQVTGTFGSVTSNLAFLTPDVDYSGNQVVLSLLRNDLTFGSVAQTDNQRAVAGAVEAVGVAQPVYRAVSVLDAESARLAFDSLSGELHASVQRAVLDDSGYLREGITQRLLATQGLQRVEGQLTDGAGPALWLKTRAGSVHASGDGNASRLDNDNRGTLLGGDLALNDTWRVGAALGESTGELHDGRRAQADVDTRSVLLYGGAQWQALQLRLGAGHSWHEVDTRRDVRAGTLSERTQARYDARSAQAFAEAGYQLSLGTWQVEPFLGLAHARARSDAFVERGGATALRGKRGEYATTYSTLGVDIQWSAGQVAHLNYGLQSRLAWQHALKDDAPERDLSLAGSAPFTIAGAPLERNSGTLQLGAWLRLSPSVVVDVHHTLQAAGGEVANQSVLGLNIAF